MTYNGLFYLVGKNNMETITRGSGYRARFVLVDEKR